METYCILIGDKIHTYIQTKVVCYKNLNDVTSKTFLAKKVYELLLIEIISENSFSLMFIITAEKKIRKR